MLAVSIEAGVVFIQACSISLSETNRLIKEQEKPLKSKELALMGISEGWDQGPQYDNSEWEEICEEEFCKVIGSNRSRADDTATYSLE